jgi:hypothetical protein
VLDDVAEHFAEFFGCSFLRGHMRRSIPRRLLMREAGVLEVTDFGILGVGFWTNRARILDVEQLTDFGRRRGTWRRR